MDEVELNLTVSPVLSAAEDMVTSPAPSSLEQKRSAGLPPPLVGEP